MKKLIYKYQGQTYFQIFFTDAEGQEWLDNNCTRIDVISYLPYTPPIAPAKPIMVTCKGKNTISVLIELQELKKKEGNITIILKSWNSNEKSGPISDHMTELQHLHREEIAMRRF